MDLENKTIILTGASGGIGEALAKKLDSKKATLVLVGRNSLKLTRLNQQLDNKHHLVITDLSTTKGRRTLLQFCKSLNSIDILINNAGVSQFSSFEDIDEDSLENLIQINLTSPMLLTQSIIPLLSIAKKSIILNVGSAFGGIGFPGFSAYCASKFGLKGFSEALKRELADTSTKVLYIAPRATNTSINSDTVTQMNHQLGTKSDNPELVANTICNQLIKETARVAIGWPEKLFLKINGLFPFLVDNANLKQLPQIKKFASLK